MSKLSEFAKQFVKIGIENFETANCFRDIQVMLPKYIKKEYGDGDLCIFHAGLGIKDGKIKERITQVYDQFFGAYLNRVSSKSEEEALETFGKMYKSFLNQNRPTERQFILGMLSIVDHFIQEYIKNKQGWEQGVDYLFGWSPDPSSKKGNLYYVFCNLVWIKVDFKVILKFYKKLFKDYAFYNPKINFNNTSFDGCFERSFTDYYEAIDPYKYDEIRDSMIFVTKNGGVIELTYTDGNLGFNLRDRVKPSDYAIDVLDIECDKESIQRAIDTEPSELIHKLDCPNYKRFLELTLKIHRNYLDLENPLEMTKEEKWMNIESVLTGLAYGLIKNAESTGFHLKKLFWNYGPSGSGKSTHAKIMEKLFPSLVVTVKTEQIYGAKSQFSLQLIFKRRWVFIDESGNYISNTGIEFLKSLSSKDTINADVKNKDYIQSSNYGVLYFNSNSRPPMGKDEAFDIRVHVNYFQHNFADKLHPDNQEEMDEKDIWEQELPEVFLMLMSCLSKLLRTKEVPKSLCHYHLIGQVIEEGRHPLMKWYAILEAQDNSYSPSFRGNFLLREVYESFVCFYRIDSKRDKTYWTNRARKRNNLADTDHVENLFLEETIKNEKVDAKSERKMPSMEDFISFLESKGVEMGQIEGKSYAKFGEAPEMEFWFHMLIQTEVKTDPKKPDLPPEKDEYDNPFTKDVDDIPF